MLNEHPDTIFTVLTGEGRFFSAGADVKAVAGVGGEAFKNEGENKLVQLGRFTYGKFAESDIKISSKPNTCV